MGNANATELTPAQARQAIDVYWRAGIPVMLHGNPGIGKTQIIQKLAKEHGLECVEIIASMLDPVDAHGLPSLDEDGFTRWAPPGFLPRDPDSRGILFFDELSSAPPLVQAAFYKLFHERKLGQEYQLPAGWYICAAGNRAEDRAVTHRLSSALNLRMAHIDLIVSIDDWRQWAVAAGIEPLVYAFIAFRPNLLNAFNAKERVSPVPRAWEAVSRIVSMLPDEALRYSLIAGLIGQAAAIEFVAFWRIFDRMPSIDAILIAPDTAPLPPDLDVRFAVINGLARLAGSSRFADALRFVERFSQREAEVAMVKLALDIHPAVAQTRAFVEWAARSGAYLS